MEQIEEYKPPKNPAKITDTRSENYILEYGESSWELDALEPRVLEEVLENIIKGYVDSSEFQKIQAIQETTKNEIYKFAKKWSE